MEATDADGEEEKVATDLARTGTSVSYCIYSSIHSFIQSFIHSFIHSFNLSFFHIHSNFILQF